MRSRAVGVSAVRAGVARMVALLGIALLAGCATVTGGKAQPPPGLNSRKLSGPTITQVLLGDATLSRILDQPFTIDARLPPRFGGPETLQDDSASASPGGCLGVAEMLHQSVYDSVQVNNVAVEAWRHVTRSTKLTSVKEGVVSLPTDADAKALFARFSQEWQRCNGQSVILPDPLLRLKAQIADVKVTPSVLAGSVSLAFASPKSDTTAIPAGRAIGVRGNCLVEVEVDFFNASDRALQGTGVLDGTSVRLAQVMMDKVSELS